jgi:hypothetical protein
MGAKTPVFALLSSLWLGIIATPLQAIPPTLQTNLSDRHLQTLEKLVVIAQQNASSVKEARVELGVASLGEGLGVEIISQTVAVSDAMTAANELFTANGNERVALENLAAVVGRSSAELLNFLK